MFLTMIVIGTTCQRWGSPSLREEPLWTDQNPSPHYPTPLPRQGRGVRNEAESEWSEIETGVLDGVLDFVFILQHPSLFLSGNKLISPKTVFPMRAICNWSPCLYLSPSAFPFYFIFVCCWKGGAREHLGEHLAVSQGQPTTDGYVIISKGFIFCSNRACIQSCLVLRNLGGNTFWFFFGFFLLLFGVCFGLKRTGINVL